MSIISTIFNPHTHKHLTLHPLPPPLSITITCNILVSRHGSISVVIKCPNDRQLRDKRAYFSSQFQIIQYIIVRKSQLQEPETASHITPTVKRRMNEALST